MAISIPRSIASSKRSSAELGSPEATARSTDAPFSVSLISCPVDYSENLRLTERLGEISAAG